MAGNLPQFSVGQWVTVTVRWGKEVLGQVVEQTADLLILRTYWGTTRIRLVDITDIRAR